MIKRLWYRVRWWRHVIAHSVRCGPHLVRGHCSCGGTALIEHYRGRYAEIVDATCPAALDYAAKFGRRLARP